MEAANMNALEENPRAGHDYEVFLNFRGSDTRKNFTDMLYEDLVSAGVHTFRDDEELRIGEEIGPNLRKAIQHSKIFIPIFSKDYASSKWCLRELTEIVKCRKTRDREILPLFFDVTPDDVKLKTGIYSKGLAQHRELYGDQVVQEWEDALREVATLKGYDLENSASGYQGRLVKTVVLTVLKKLKLTYLAITENLVGASEPIRELMELLDASGDAGIIGIHGMGGIGKTTIAKLVYNKLCDRFESCSFLADVRESSKQHMGIENLQNKLLSDILGRKCCDISSVGEGIDIIRRRCSDKNALILLDDVDDIDQLKALAGRHDWFGSRSRIIVTTRNKDILKLHELVWRYELKVLDLDKSLELFSKHAFRRDTPPPGYYNIAQEIASTAAGLPLALEVIGSSLCGKSETIWKETSRKLQKIPNHQVQKKLSISYEALEGEHREIFLDIACHFIGEDKSMPMYMWEDCGLFPETGLEELVLRSLVKITHNRLKMHDQLRDLGREIVRQENVDEPGERSRLWSHEALDTLKTKRGTKKVQSLSIKTIGVKKRFRYKEKVLHSEGFKELNNLKLLQIDNIDLVGDFDRLLSKVRLLSWRRCPSNLRAANMCLERLVILDLSSSRVADDWDGWNLIKMMKNLKVLDLSNCIRLGRLPDLSSNTSLERLILKSCVSLCQIDSSICKLKNLILLNINWCKKLNCLFPDFEFMENLKELCMDFTPIQQIPVSRKMKKLEILSADGCRSLTGTFPDSMFNLESLVTLNLKSVKWTGLPDSIGNLKMLKVLHISHSNITKIPSTIGMLTRLEVLNVSFCSSLEGDIPGDIGRLVLLRRLHFKFTKICSLPVSINGLPSLQYINLGGCKKLEFLPELPISLEVLTLTWSPMKDFTRLQHLVNLKKLRLIGCINLAEIPSDIGKFVKLNTLEFIESNFISLPPEIASLSALKNLLVHKCRRLQSLPRLPANLYELNIEFCDLLVELSDLTNMKKLSTLRIVHCSNLTTIKGFGNLESLTRLCVQDCKRVVDIEGLSKLESLQYLNLYGYEAIEKLLDLSNLKMLKYLEIWYCRRLLEIEGLGNLESLEELRINICEALKNVSDVSKLEKLTKLKIWGCERLFEIKGLDKLKSVRRLNLDVDIQCPRRSTLDLSSSQRIFSDYYFTVTQAIQSQEAHRRSNNWMPPSWAIVAMVILGFNELMLLLKNPLYLLVIFVLYLLSKALWVQMDIAGEFRNGIVPALLSISARFLPTIMNLLKRLAEAAHGHALEGQQPPPVSPQSFRSQASQALLHSSALLYYELDYIDLEAHRRSNNWMPPSWAIVAMVILGFNELMLLLKNPLYLLVIFVLYLLSKALWVQMDIAGEFRNGIVPALLSISARFLPTIMNLLKRLAEAAHGHALEGQQPPPVSPQSFRSQASQANTTSDSVPESSVSSNISTVDSGAPYSSPNLTHRRTANVPEAEFS